MESKPELRNLTTEERNQASLHIDTFSTTEIVSLSPRRISRSSMRCGGKSPASWRRQIG